MRLAIQFIEVLADCIGINLIRQRFRLIQLSRSDADTPLVARQAHHIGELRRRATTGKRCDSAPTIVNHHEWFMVLVEPVNETMRSESYRMPSAELLP
jgi:hypothetical protein